MTTAEFIAALKEHGPKHVYHNCLLSNDVFLFAQSFNAPSDVIYHEFKGKVSTALNIAAPNIAIVGSAKTGFSLTPGRGLSPFHSESDLDLVLVSSKWFKYLWDAHLEYMYSYSGISYKNTAKEVFRHFISIKTEEISGEKLNFFKDWIEVADALRKDLQIEFKLPSEINYRIYEDWYFVEKYHLAGINQLQGQL
ncbi:hypothetical protein WIX39_025950 [Variovorax sp. AB1(2024)]|uniref:hypothetical protein n=1 Tax=Variovorax sp. AB1(2024) TaxID=3132214 RepID=UPI0030B25BCB